MLETPWQLDEKGVFVLHFNNKPKKWICSHPGVCMRKGPVNSRCVHFQSHKKYLASGSCSRELVSAGGAKTSLGKKGHVVQRGIFDDLELYEATCPAVVSQV